MYLGFLFLPLMLYMQMHEAPGKLPCRRLWLVMPLILLMFGSLPLSVELLLLP